jgi:RNA polymerase sigma-70 factor (ECF subfamily)
LAKEKIGESKGSGNSWGRGAGRNRKKLGASCAGTQVKEARIQMAATYQRISSASYLPQIEDNCSGSYRDIYQTNRHRLYALAFWMTDNELLAENLMQRTFRQAFSLCPYPSPELLDRTLMALLRRLMPLGQLTLECGPSTQVLSVRRNTLRVHLERAIVKIAPTERLVFLLHDVENYTHQAISRCLGLSAGESRRALHQARLRIRELLSQTA